MKTEVNGNKAFSNAVRHQPYQCADFPNQKPHHNSLSSPFTPSILGVVVHASFATRTFRLMPLIELSDGVHPSATGSRSSAASQLSALALRLGTFHVILTKPDVDPLDRSLSLLQTLGSSHCTQIKRCLPITQQLLLGTKINPSILRLCLCNSPFSGSRCSFESGVRHSLIRLHDTCPDFGVKSQRIARDC